MPATSPIPFRTAGSTVGERFRYEGIATAGAKQIPASIVGNKFAHKIDYVWLNAQHVYPGHEFKAPHKPLAGYLINAENPALAIGGEWSLMSLRTESRGLQLPSDIDSRKLLQLAFYLLRTLVGRAEPTSRLATDARAAAQRHWGE